MMEKAKGELIHIQKRLDVIIALADSDIQARKEEWNETKEAWIEASEARRTAAQQQRAKFSENVTLKAGELKSGIEEKFAKLKQRAMEKPSAYLESAREEINELRIKYRVSAGSRDEMKKTRRTYGHLLRSNPSMTSRVFKDAWEEFKKNMESGPEDGEEQG